MSYSGWKNDFIANLVLGHCGGDSVRETKKSAEYWFKEHWKLTRDSEETDSKKRAFWAAVELNALKATGETPKPTLAPRQGISRSVGDYFLEAWANRWPHTLSEGSADPPPSNSYDKYRKYALFIQWLGKHWHKLCIKKHGPPLHENAADNFLSARSSPVERGVLVELAEAYDKCYKPPMGDKNEHLPSVYEVLLKFVAERHGVSTTPVAQARAGLNKKSTRP